MAYIKFKCPACRQHLETEEGDAGTHVQCPSCKVWVIVPRHSPKAPGNGAPDNTLNTQDTPGKCEIRRRAAQEVGNDRRPGFRSPILVSGAIVLVILAVVVGTG